jgi:hypothetical protein
MTEFKFTDEQAFALTQLGNGQDYYALKGYAGTGKTTVITHWVKDKRKKPDKCPKCKGDGEGQTTGSYSDIPVCSSCKGSGKPSPFWRAPKIVLTAPTNKATGVLDEKAKELKLPVDVSTIHSLLGLKMKWAKDEQILVEDRQGEDKFSEYDYVVIDEASMLGEEILRYVCRAQKRSENCVIFMGDPCQLPPIGEKESRSFNAPEQTELKQVVRQAKGNPIMDLGIYLRESILAPTSHYPRRLFEFVDNEHIFYTPLADNEDTILSAFASPDERDIRHVAWTNKVVDSWNNKIRDRIYGFDREDWVRGELIVTTAPVLDPYEDGIVFSTDTLLKIQNTPELHMHQGVMCWQLKCESHYMYVIADQGRKEYRTRKEELLREAKLDGKKWRKFYEFMEAFSSVKPAHSLTVHRSQGSTFDDVYVSFQNILVNPNRRESLQCLYVAVTRPRGRLFLV